MRVAVGNIEAARSYRPTVRGQQGNRPIPLWYKVDSERGRYFGTLVGVVLIVLLNTVLSIMEMPEAGRQVIYGFVINAARLWTP